MRTARILHYIFFFSLFTAVAQAQTLKSFSSEPDKYLEELRSIMTETGKEEGEMVMQEFLAIWHTGGTMTPKEQEKMYEAANKLMEKRLKDQPGVQFEPYGASSRKLSDNQKNTIIRLSNQMLKRRLKPFPDFHFFLYTMISFVKSGQSEASFNAWSASMDKLLQGNVRHFSAFITSCNNLFMNNAIYSSASTQWKSNNNNYTFEFDSIPKVIFSSLDLTCKAKGDSFVIAGTKGIYLPTRNLWNGEGGKVVWTRAGLKEEECYALLRKYHISMTGSDYEADSVTCYYKAYFPEPLLGKFSDKLLANTTDSNATYPRFQSYNAQFRIKDIVKKVDYSGGFSIQGNRMIGSGNDLEDASLTFYKENNKRFLVAKSKTFMIRPDRITAARSEVTFYFEEDSIYHPGAEFKFITKDRELALIRGQEGVGPSPFFDTYHKMDLYFDALYWKIDSLTMQMKMISGEGENRASFESANYYKEARFNRIQGISDTHPFTIIKQFTDKQQSREIYVEDLAKHMNLSVGQVRLMAIDFSNKGFMIFYPRENKILVKDRLYFYLQAKVGKTDYDVLQISSLISGRPNATVNLLNLDLHMEGVSQIQLSDSQNVFIIPRNQQVTLKKDRDIKFDGRVHAGRFDFYGKEFYFQYEGFKIDLNNVDSLRLKVPAGPPDPATGKVPLVSVKSVIEHITGDLLIDEPLNKSGLTDIPGYPIFNSKKDSYVYYDKKEVQQGVYSRDKFYFHVNPFTIDSLDNFSAEGLSFAGTLSSANIFPDFKEVLKLQPDNSLGFVRPTPENGFPAYGGKGTYSNTIRLSHEGLRGDGVLKYLTSTAWSNDFIFFPDSMNTYAQRFEIEKSTKGGIEYPPVKAEDVYIHWMPYKDRMFINKRSKPMDFYEGQAAMNGNIELTPQELTGNGIMAFAASELESKLFRYKLNAFGADTSDFRLTSDNTQALAFQTSNVKSTIDFTTRTGMFKANSGGNYVTFPVNQYICYIDQFKWFMDQKEIELSASSGTPGTGGGTNLDLEGSEFVSINSDQDSLRFFAPFAKYSLSDYLIQCKKVKYIPVADAKIFPDSGNVTVEKKAKMRTLGNSIIIANATTEYHRIFNATTNVYGRRKYESEGDYEFVDLAKRKQLIHFKKVEVDTTYQTIAVGDVSDTTFTLSPQFSYKGSAFLKASNQFLAYKGVGRINLNCPGAPRNWFRFEGEINPDDISIPITSEMKEESGEKLSASISFTTGDSAHVYTAFLAKKEKTADDELLKAQGYLVYDKATNEYRIASKDKLQNDKLPGNYLSFNDNKCISYGEGKVELIASDQGQFKMQTVGNVTHNLNDNSTSMDVMMAINFFFAEDALKAMAENIASITTLAPTADNRPTYEKGLAELIGKEKADKMITEINLYGGMKKIPSELQYTLFLTEVKLAWDERTKSFHSYGNIGLGNIMKEKINKLVNGYVEVVRKRSGDLINIYIEADDFNWYFFTYQRGLMSAISSNTAFNDVIKNLKPDKRVSKGEKGEASFTFQLSTERKKQEFVKKMRNPEGSE